MESATSPSSSTCPRLCCIAASSAPIVAVIARCYGQPRWTCVLRWDWKAGTLQEGAWTTMGINAHRCRISDDGEFLYYHAEGPTHGPFSAYYGGAFAVSRLPWLSALTDPRTFGPGGGGKSRDGLGPEDQERLWNLFADWPGYIRDEHWPLHLGSGWLRVESNDSALAAIAPRRRVHMAAASELPEASLRLLVVVETRGGKRDPRWSLWHDDLRFLLSTGAGSDARAVELPGVRWAQPVGGGRLLVATDQASLQVVRFAYNAGLPEVPRVEQTHSLAGLVPRPIPSPEWARAPLGDR